MVDPLSNQIIGKIKQAPELYHRLVLVVAPSGSGKTSALKEVRQGLRAPLINVNLEISRRMLELTTRQRALQASRLLEDILRQNRSDVVLLDNIEILFEKSLEQDPLRLLQGLSRNRTIVATWNGEIGDNYLIYAAPDHPEYRRYSCQDLQVVTQE
ncbi:MAG: BREX-3 system P-loop-containing protein BrxF [Deltaproteobacteria bacterium]|nr:BREX-3 system P-loop-containing protein BrxF [Deltaproteobacteria bacterium]MBW1792906.1 BREX-3 system P-loop-containing protein BrxF [Deltaproteobacteria bacterium]MBW2330376.1 BREX-3 system P-loop-containing protein BrxF [Deltaproteobacteria bacterium]